MISLRRLPWFVLCMGLGVAWADRAIAQEATGIKWRTEYNAARKEAQEKGLPLLIDFMTQNCFWCKELDNKTFKDAGVTSALNEKFVPLKVDAEREPGLASMLGISSYPTVVIAAPEGKVISSVVGFKDVPTFNDLMQRALTQVTPPDWMQKDLAMAQKWIASGDYPRAINALKIILDDGKGRPMQTQAETLMSELEKKAADNLERAKVLQDKDAPKAIELITETMRSFPGLQATKEATDLLTKMATAADFRNKDRAKRAQDLLTQARDFYKNKEYIPCLDRCEILLSGFGDLPEGQEGALLASDIKSNSEWLQNAADTMSERLGGVYLALADTLLKRGQPDRATFYLNRVVTAFPGSRLAESAQIRLEQLQGTSGIRPTTGVTVSRP